MRRSSPQNVILTLVKLNFAQSGQPNPWALHDLGLAIGNLTLQASALDLYVHNMGGFSPEKAQTLFNLPADVRPVTMIAIGYRGEIAQLPEGLQAREKAVQVRNPLEELILS